MKNLIAIAVLCMASVVMAQIDYDLVAYFDGCETLLENTGDDAINIYVLGFVSDEGHILVPPPGMPEPLVYDPLVATEYELTYISPGSFYVMPAGQITNLGQITEVCGDQGWYWQQNFAAVGGVAGYIFELVIPEPASMSILAIGALAIIRCRKYGF